MSCCLVRLSNGGLGPTVEIIVSQPTRTRRNICRGAALTSRLDLLAFSGDERGRSRALFLLCLTEHPFQIQSLSIFHATQRSGLPDASLPSRLQ